MITTNQIKQKGMRLWNSGRLLRAWMGCEETLFPLTIPAGKPAASQLLNEFSLVGDWKASIEAYCQCHLGHGYRIEYTQINHRQLGQQRLPVKLVFDQVSDLVAFLNKGREVSRFARIVAQVKEADPRLMPWCERYPIKALELEKQVSRLLSVVDFFKQHPTPNRYLRELDIPGVDSKFVEQHKQVIGQLLDLVLPAEAIDQEITGMARNGFERRFGLKYDEPLIRFRLLDARLVENYGGMTDITLPLSQFVRLNPGCGQVFITENKINGLSFPDYQNSMVIFGLGYGISALKDIAWLKHKSIRYWGDIDTHGFAILSQLRSYYPQTESMLMDRQTLEQFKDLWVTEDESKRCLAQLPNLQPAEHSLLAQLKDNALGHNVRLEQERVPFDWVRGLRTEESSSFSQHSVALF